MLSCHNFFLFYCFFLFFFFQAEDGIRDRNVTGVQTCALPIYGVDTINVLPDLNDSNKAYMVPVGGTNDQEYFIMENRQQKGWDAFIPGHGMLLWHIDYDAKAWEKDRKSVV